jgi:hypothetical protein
VCIAKLVILLSFQAQSELYCREICVCMCVDVPRVNCAEISQGKLSSRLEMTGLMHNSVGCEKNLAQLGPGLGNDEISCLTFAAKPMKHLCQHCPREKHFSN